MIFLINCFFLDKESCRQRCPRKNNLPCIRFTVPCNLLRLDNHPSCSWLRVVEQFLRSFSSPSNTSTNLLKDKVRQKNSSAKVTWADASINSSGYEFTCWRRQKFSLLCHFHFIIIRVTLCTEKIFDKNRSSIESAGCDSCRLSSDLESVYPLRLQRRVEYMRWVADNKKTE